MGLVNDASVRCPHDSRSNCAYNGQHSVELYGWRDVSVRYRANDGASRLLIITLVASQNGNWLVPGLE